MRQIKMNGIIELVKKAKSQQKQWKRPSNQVINEMIEVLEIISKQDKNLNEGYNNAKS